MGPHPHPKTKPIEGDSFAALASPGFGHKAQCEGCSPWIHKLQRARETNRTTAFTGPDTAHDCRWVVPNRFAALADFWDEDLAKECGCNYGAEEDAQEQRAEIVRSTQSFSLAGSERTVLVKASI